VDRACGLVRDRRLFLGGAAAIGALTMRGVSLAGDSRAFPALLLLAALAGVFVCARHPEPFPSDEDEGFQMTMVTAPAPVFWRMLARDAVHPPLDYLADRAWERAFPGSCQRRIPPIAWGFFGVLAFGALLASRAGRTAGLSGALLFALALYRVSETRRLRPYPLGLFLMLLCLALLDAHLRRPGAWRFGAAFATGVATFWTLYLAGAVLLVAAAALCVEDLFSPDPVRRQAAGRLARRSPLVLLAGFAAAAPLAPLLRAAAGRRSPVAAPEFSLSRMGRILSYSAYSPNAGWGFAPRPLFVAGFVVAAALFAAGAVVAWRRPGTRFLLAWAAGGWAIVDVAKRAHPHWDSFRYFLPAIAALTALEGVAIAAARRRAGLGAAAAILAALLLLELPSYARFYRYGVWRFSSGARGTARLAPRRPGGVSAMDEERGLPPAERGPVSPGEGRRSRRA
jgi:hypothetical protein